jgi:hypothetical protein
MLLEEAYQKLLERCHSEALGGVRKVFYYQRTKQSAFYKTVSILFTNQFMHMTSEHDGRYVMFAVCSTDGGAEGENPKIGVEFERFTQGDVERISLWSEPDIRRVESLCIRDAMRNLHPMPPLEVPLPTVPIPSVVVASSNGDDGREVRLVQQLPTKNTAGGGGIEIERYLSSALVTPERIEQLRALILHPAVQKHLLALRVERECVTKNLCGWRLVFRFEDAPVDVIKRETKSAEPIVSSASASASHEDDADDTY